MGMTRSRNRNIMATMMIREDRPCHASARSWCLLVRLGGCALGCANMTPTQQRALSGGAMGAAGGAALGAIVGGSPALGAAVGGAVGTATGALWGDLTRALK
jgi:osmotically inducible lipoprotein OsmB